VQLVDRGQHERQQVPLQNAPHKVLVLVHQLLRSREVS
jgi:hypothetical protein